MALTNPKAAIMNAKEMFDVRFIKELDDTAIGLRVSKCRA